MSVIYWKEIADGRDGSSTLEERRNINRISRVFRAVTDDPLDDGYVIGNYAYSQGIMIGARHPKDLANYCRSVTNKQDGKTKTVWICTAQYSSERQVSENPLNDPADISWSADSYQRPYFKDRDGKAILNSCGHYYIKAVEGDDSRWTCTVKKNLSGVPSWILSYRNAINNDSFSVDGISVDVGCAKLSAIRISNWQQRNGVYYRCVELSIHFNADGWDKELLDEGLYRREDPAADGNQDIIHRCVDNDGMPAKHAMPLDGKGHQLPSPTPDTAVFNKAKIYPQQPFSSLPLY